MFLSTGLESDLCFKVMQLLLFVATSRNNNKFTRKLPHERAFGNSSEYSEIFHRLQYSFTLCHADGNQGNLWIF